MNPRSGRTRVLWLLGLIALLVVGSLFFTRGDSHEQAARQKLDSVLGTDSNSGNLSELPPAQNPGGPDSNAPMLPPGWDLSNMFHMPDVGVQVQETPQAYTLRIPLADPKDESSVKLSVNPHHIEVSGQSGTQKDGASMTSSFMQSFTTASELLPDKISKKQEKKGSQTELVITIPKKNPGQSASPNRPTDIPPALPAPEQNPGITQPQPDQEPDLDSSHHVVI